MDRAEYPGNVHFSYVSDFNRNIHITGKKKKLVEFTLDLLLAFYLNRCFGGVYNRPTRLNKGLRDPTNKRRL
jgi:hypothetical protein